MGRLDALNAKTLLWVVDDVLEPSTCEQLIDEIEAAHPKTVRSSSPLGTVRKNDRHIVTRPELALRVFERIRDVLPSPLVSMRPVSANECLRFYRYRAGDFFKPHQDTHFVRSRDERTLLSVVVYLNEGFEGGETEFCDAGRVVEPRPGRAAVFGHRMVHASRPMISGVKYAFRSDVMYRRETSERLAAASGTCGS